MDVVDGSSNSLAAAAKGKQPTITALFKKGLWEEENNDFGLTRNRKKKRPLTVRYAG